MEKRKLGFFEYFYIFLMGCLFGYVVEVLWSFYRHHIFINHTALVVGPFNIVYGISAVVLSMFLKKYRNDNVIKLFFVSFVMGTVLEYALSFTMEKMAGFVAWDYSKYFLNINGRVCLKYSIFWGILGIAWIKYIYPLTIKIIDNFDKKKAVYFMNFLIVFLLADGFLTLQAIDRAKEYEKGIPPGSKYEEYLDNYFGVDYLDNMYNYRWNKR